MRPPTYVMGSKVNLGSSGILKKGQGSCPCKSTACLVSSSFCQHVNISYMLHSILTKLGLNDQYLDRYSHTNNDGVRGHDGVTGVTKVIFTKIAISPSDNMVWSRDSCIYISLTPSIKVIGLKIHPGSLGVTGVKRSFSPKMLFLFQITWYGHVTHAYTSA